VEDKSSLIFLKTTIGLYQEIFFFLKVAIITVKEIASIAKSPPNPGARVIVGATGIATGVGVGV
jgi:hypothetical protein